ncbi:hypothetical protein [Ferruginibacter profundus]
MKTKFFFPFVLFFLCGCSFNKTNKTALTGTWRLYDVAATTAQSKEEDTFDKDARLKQTVKEGHVLCFFENGTYTEIKGKEDFRSGSWDFSGENKSIAFKDSAHPVRSVKINIETNVNGKEQLAVTDLQQKLTLKFIKESEPMKDLASDPFYPANNQWRIKAKQPEDSAQLTIRLANYLKHIALILKAAQERKQDIVSFEFSLGPIKIYNGGIGAHPYTIVPETWKNCFYNDSDALTAYSMYEDYLKNGRYKGAGVGNWIEDDYNILLSIYADIAQHLPVKSIKS